MCLTLKPLLWSSLSTFKCAHRSTLVFFQVRCGNWDSLHLLLSSGRSSFLQRMVFCSRAPGSHFTYLLVAGAHLVESERAVSGPRPTHFIKDTSSVRIFWFKSRISIRRAPHCTHAAARRALLGPRTCGERRSVLLRSITNTICGIGVYREGSRGPARRGETDVMRS